MEQQTTFAPLPGLFFEDLLAQAVEAPSDAQAQAALSLHVEAVIEQGDAERLMTMSVVLGATACMHPHLENLANTLGEQVMPHDKHGGHDHGTDPDDDEDDE